MKPELSEINNILLTCDAMLNEIEQCGLLKRGNQNYEKYKRLIRDFMKSNKVDEE